MKIATTSPSLLALGLVIPITFTGCVRREGRNSECIWPKEAGARALDPSRRDDARHLREDVEFAEELAVEYMDAQRRSRSGQPPGQVMNTCRNSLLKQISTSHNVPPKEVIQSFGRRSLAIDLAIILPFLLLYGLMAALLAGWLRRRYPPEDSMAATLAMALLCSLALGVAGLLLGEFWTATAESIRVGTGHLSYRVDRLPWARHRIVFFGLCVALFWSAAAIRFRVRQRHL
jgi:hypothetical protein